MKEKLKVFKISQCRKDGRSMSLFQFVSADNRNADRQVLQLGFLSGSCNYHFFHLHVPRDVKGVAVQ